MKKENRSLELEVSMDTQEQKQPSDLQLTVEYAPDTGRMLAALCVALGLPESAIKGMLAARHAEVERDTIEQSEIVA